MFRVVTGKVTGEGQELGFEYAGNGVNIRAVWMYRPDNGGLYREDWQELVDSLNAGLEVFRLLDTDGQRRVTFTYQSGVIVIDTPNAQINVSAPPLKVQIIKCCEELAKKHKCRPLPPPMPVAVLAPVVVVPEPVPVVEPVPEPAPVVEEPAPVVDEPAPVRIPTPAPVDDDALVIEQLPPRQPTPEPVVVVEEPAVAPVVEEPAPAAQPDQPAAQIPLQAPADEHDEMEHAEDNIAAEKDVMQFINQYLAGN